MKFACTALAAMILAVVCTTETQASCIEGFTQKGNTCFMLVREKMSWNTAALNCGNIGDGVGIGVQLARYDNEQQHEDLDAFFHSMPELDLRFQTTKTVMECTPASPCDIPEGLVGLRAVVTDPAMSVCCEGKMIFTNDRTQFIVQEGCLETQFEIETIPESEFVQKQTVTWIGGNGQILTFGARDDQPPIQVDPPRSPRVLVEGCERGCFLAKRNRRGELRVKAQHDCGDKMASICSYDITQPPADPLDLIVLPNRVPYGAAKAKCKREGRPLATIKTAEQQAKIDELAAVSAGPLWLSARYRPRFGVFRWADGSLLDYTNWRWENVRTKNNEGVNLFCAVALHETGKWVTRRCGGRFFPVCGPPEPQVPEEFTDYYQISGRTTLRQLKQQLRILGAQDFICKNPTMMECSAKSSDDGSWVTNAQQEGNALKCRRNNISCRNNRGFDCSTFRIRFQCPIEKDSCKILKDLDAQACTGGRLCFPVENHFTCKCPSDQTWSQHEQRCIKSCGVCTSWGDPHFTGLQGLKYDFMGTCEYQYVGVCKPEEFASRPYFDIQVDQVKCANRFQRQGTCINAVTVNLYQIPLYPKCSTSEKVDFTFHVEVFYDYFMLNGEKFSNQMVDKDGVYHAVVRQSYFSLAVHALDIKVLLSGRKLSIHIPEKFEGKLCGLCGDCGSKAFKTRDGTLVNVPESTSRRGRLDKEAIAQFALTWMNPEQQNNEECAVQTIGDSCSDAAKESVSGADMCGMFLPEADNILKVCFDQTNLQRNNYYHGCLYDLCEMENPSEAVCGVLETFFQECMIRGVFLDWRREDFCPMECPGDLEYVLDASCQSVCSMPQSAQALCDEEPADGCACPNGFRLGDSCVPWNQCGCHVLDDYGNYFKYLEPNASTVLPGCTAQVLCETQMDGTTTQVRSAYTLPDGTSCSVSAM